MQTPTDPSPTPEREPQTQSIAEARDLVAFAAQTREALQRAGERLVESAPHDEERAWLAAATRRVDERVQGVQAKLAAAGDLPELEGERRAQAEALFAAWVDSVEALLVGISTHASPQNPLIEVLFPHQKFDRVRRGGGTARAYMAEVERRRNMAYVLRLSGEPEYAFLVPLLERFDGARQALEQREQPIERPVEELNGLRREVLAAADALRAVLQQARLLADAALHAHPGWLGELGLDAKPKKRAVRAQAAAEPA